MNWEQHAQSALHILEAANAPASELIITLIKSVNPTSRLLPPADKERAYELKNRLQNLLLETYGECFSLVPHPVSPDIVLIKHLFLPSVDACHADLRRLSVKALDTVSDAPAAAAAPSPPRKVAAPRRGTASATDSKGALAIAQQCLDRYDYSEAESVLSQIRIADRKELPVLLRAARLLSGEMGLLGPAIELLLSQREQLLREKPVREILACCYHGNGDLAEARALFDSLRPEELGKEALFACADIAFRDGNPGGALQLLEQAERSEGFAAGIAGLRADVEAALLAAAQPILTRAVAALDGGDPTCAAALVASVLQQYPQCRPAREVMARIELMKRQDGAAALWEEFARTDVAADRLRILGRLRELDQGNGDRIGELIVTEKNRQKEALVEERLEELSRRLGKADWPGCFDIVRSLAEGGKALSEGVERAVALSPLFSLLYRNERLDRLQPHLAKKRWLEFVAVTESLAAGHGDSSFEAVKELREYFEGCRLFDSTYEQLLKEEQEKVRREIRRLLSAEGTSYDDLSRIFARIRAMMAILPEGERTGYTAEMSALHGRLKPAFIEKIPVHEYFDAALMGLDAKGARLREKINDSTVVAAIDAELATLFRIDCEPLALSFSEELPIDLEGEDKTLTRMGANSRQVLLREDAETLVLIDLWTRTAARYRSVLFRDVKLCDSLPDSNSFLFIDYGAEQLLLRATLSPAGSRVTSLFMADLFSFHPDDFVFGAFMSGMEATHYYLFTEDMLRARAGKCIKQCPDGTSRTVKTRSDRISSVKRLRSDQDTFLYDTRYGNAVFNHNLAHQITVSDDMVRVFAFDSEKLYIMTRGAVLAYDHHMKNGEILAEHDNNTLLHKMDGFAPATDIAFRKKYDGSGFFHRISDGCLSQLFRLDKVIWTPTPSTWYYCDYQMSSGQIRLRELHPETDDLFQWTDPYPKLTAAKEDTPACSPGDGSEAD